MLNAESPNQFALHLNGSAIPGSRYSAGSDPQSHRNTGQAIFTVSTIPSTLTLNNDTSTGTVTLDPIAGGTVTGTSASVLIRKLT
jgi:hypothetical protein